MEAAAASTAAAHRGGDGSGGGWRPQQRAPLASRTASRPRRMSAVPIGGRTAGTTATDTLVDVLLEFLEALVHQILFERGLYAPELFQRQRLYGIAVRRSRHPDLNAYIAEAVAGLRVRLLLLLLLLLLRCGMLCAERSWCSSRSGAVDASWPPPSHNAPRTCT